MTDLTDIRQVRIPTVALGLILSGDVIHDDWSVED